MRVSSWALFAGAAITAGMFGMLGFGIGRNSVNPRPAGPPSRLALMSPRVGGSPTAALTRQIAITPDGSGVVFVTQMDDGDEVLAYQRLDSESATLIGGAAGVLSPEVSNDGRFITGMAEGTGTPGNVRVTVPMRGGSPRPVDSGKTPDVGENATAQQLLDRDRKALVVRSRADGRAGTALLRDMKTGAERQILDEPVVEMRYAAEHLIYVREDGTLWAAPFDLEEGRLTAPAVQIGSGVSMTGNGIAQMAVARNGNVAYLPEEPWSLVLVTRAGRLRSATTNRQLFASPQFSPDGSRISVDFTTTEGRDVWLVPAAGGELMRATFERDAHDAAWTPDGRSITFTSFRRGALGIYRAVPGSRQSPDSVFTAAPLAYSGSWLGDGSGIVTTALNLQAHSRADIALITNGGHGPLVPILADAAATRFPAVSPDGKWLAYVSNITGRDEVYVRPWRSPGDAVRISENGGTEPVWNPDSREIFYRANGNRRLVVASVRSGPGPALTLTDRRSLFPIADMVPGVTHANYDVSPDGSTFVMVRRAANSRIMVLQNVPAMVREARNSRID